MPRHADFDRQTVDFLSVFLATGSFLWKRHNEVYKKHNLSPPQLGLLYHLTALGPVSLSELRARVPGHLSNIAQIVDRMVKAGWVESSRDEADRRRVVIAPTRKALRTLESIEPFGFQKAIMTFVSSAPPARKKALQAVGLLADLFGLTAEDIREETERHFGPEVLDRLGIRKGGAQPRTGGGNK